jgi:chemotaxis protein MotB
MARKKEAHHGGAWKVAYADFVTAMMALFMVLWICAQDRKIQIATSKYFQSPFRSPMQDHSGIMPFNKEQRNASSTDGKEDDAAGKEKAADKSKQIELSFLNSVAAEFYRLINLDQNLADKPIEIQVTSDGLRVTLFNRSNRQLFVDNTTEFTEWGRFVIQSLAWMIDRHKFRVNIDGHTRAKIEFKDEKYSAWELSADRANAARRDLVHFAVDAGLIERVTGYADTQPLPGQAPESDSNQRLTLSLTFSKKRTAATAGPAPAAGASTGQNASGKRPVATPGSGTPLSLFSPPATNRP